MIYKIAEMFWWVVPAFLVYLAYEFVMFVFS